MDQSIDAESLASQLEQLALNEQRQGILPSPRQLFAVGRILFRISSSQKDENEDDGSDLFFAYQHLVDSIPDSHWDYVSSCFQKAAKTLLHNGNLTDWIAATESWCGLFTRAPKLCPILYSKEWIALLSMMYDAFVVQNATPSQKQVILASLSSLLLDGLFLPSSSTSSSTIKESLQEHVLEAIQAMEQHSTDCLADLQTWQSQKEPFRRTLASEIRKYTTTTTTATENMEQWEYILDMLQSVQQRDASTARVIAMPNASSTTSQQPPTAAISKPVSAADELERRIQQVKQILPDYGEGFIETALSLYQGNVETTIATLFSEDSPSYPAALRVLDKSLPRRRKHRSDEEAAQAAQARQLVKERVAMEQKQQEAQYKALLYVQRQEEQEDKNDNTKSTTAKTKMSLHDEYDDDYDDQYDDIDVKLGGADDGMYDFEQVKLYNKFVRAEEADDAFWQENQNTNRKPANNSNNKKNNNNNKPSQNEDDETEDGPAKQYRGPDKIKGGRVIGPDGKVVRKPGGGKKTPNTNNNSNNTNADGPAKPTNGSGPKSTTNGTTTGGNSTTTGGNDSTKNKPRTKPKAQNRVNRQRDKKQRAQGTFGVQE